MLFDYRPDLAADERYGRRVVFEFTKNYPVVMSPTFSYDELREIFKEYLEIYYTEEIEWIF